MARVTGFPKPQMLRQKHERGCGVCVFARLAGITEDELLKELPDADLGTISVNDWQAWLEAKGFVVTRRDGCPDDVVPCAHLVGHGVYTREDVHWVYRDEDADVLDPSPVNQFMPANDPRMKRLDVYGEKILTLTIARRAST
jgi:hypothetical protein